MFEHFTTRRTIAVGQALLAFDRHVRGLPDVESQRARKLPQGVCVLDDSELAYQYVEGPSIECVKLTDLISGDSYIYDARSGLFERSVTTREVVGGPVDRNG